MKEFVFLFCIVLGYLLSLVVGTGQDIRYYSSSLELSGRKPYFRHIYVDLTC